MTFSLVFNDLSLRCQAPDRETARAWMSDFVETLEAAAYQKVTALRMRSNFKDLMLSPDYPMAAWFGDKKFVSRDESLFVLEYATRYSLIRPFDDDLRDDEGFQSGKDLFEGKFEGDKAEGLGFAYLLGGLAFSILSEPCWDTTSLALDCLEWNPESQEFIEFCETLRHVSRSSHVLVDHAGWIKEQIRTGVSTGSNLLQKATTLFPNLVFCNGARKQMEDLTASSVHLPRILVRLFELEELANAWERDNFNYLQIRNASPESPSTMGKYGARRVFVCPDGQQRTFEWHLKSLPYAWRIHIWADPTQKKILIGYVGKHLPTVGNPT